MEIIVPKDDNGQPYTLWIGNRKRKQQNRNIHQKTTIRKGGEKDAF